MGALTDDLRNFLANAPKLMLLEKKYEQLKELAAQSSSSSSDSSSDSPSSSSDSSGSDSDSSDEDEKDADGKAKLKNATSVDDADMKMEKIQKSPK